MTNTIKSIVIPACPAFCSAVWNAVRAECKKTADSVRCGIQKTELLAGIYLYGE